MIRLTRNSDVSRLPIHHDVTSAELTPGQTFGGYRIQHLLGRGGMGAVYAAEQIEDGRLVAVKVLAAGLERAEDRERFLREGRTAASVNHPNTVYVYRTEEIEGRLTIAMELVEGGTLEQKVEAQGPLSVIDAIDDTLQLIDGLEAAHRRAFCIATSNQPIASSAATARSRSAILACPARSKVSNRGG